MGTKYKKGCCMKIYEMGTQSLYNPSQTNPASQALAGYNTGSVTGATPGLDARSAIPGLGIGLDNIVGGGINAIGSYMHGENQRQKMMAQNRNQQDMVASQNSQMRRFGAVEGQQTDTVLRNEDLNSLNSSYQRMYEEGTEAVDTNAPTPDSAMIEVEKDELIFRRFGASYQLVADFIGGDTHEEGGEPFVAEEGDVIFPGSMRDMILPMVDDSGLSNTNSWMSLRNSANSYRRTLHRVQRKIKLFPMKLSVLECRWQKPLNLKWVEQSTLLKRRLCNRCRLMLVHQPS
jgi:hypothetical protein